MVYFKKWFETLNIRDKKIEYRVQIHVDQNPAEIIDYWKKVLQIKEVVIMRKSNLGKMSGRSWNSKYGVLIYEVF